MQSMLWKNFKCFGRNLEPPTFFLQQVTVSHQAMQVNSPTATKQAIIFNNASSSHQLVGSINIIHDKIYYL